MTRGWLLLVIILIIFASIGITVLLWLPKRVSSHLPVLEVGSWRKIATTRFDT
jgi:hypothetical protein